MYVEWLAYLIKRFLEPWGYVLNGGVGWRGGDWDDVGVIVVIENKVRAVIRSRRKRGVAREKHREASGLARSASRS